MAGIASAGAIGTPDLIPIVSAIGIPAAEAVGAPEIALGEMGDGDIDINLNGIVGGEAFGDATVDLKAISIPTPGGGVYAHRVKLPTRRKAPSAPKVPSYSAPSPITISARGIESTAKVGKPSLILSCIITSSGVKTAEIFGKMEVIIPEQVRLARQRYEQDEITALLMAA
jgi:hypothetical protein